MTYRDGDVAADGGILDRPPRVKDLHGRKFEFLACPELGEL
jgi:hypothetical protein